MKLVIGKSYRVKSTLGIGSPRTMHLYKEITGVTHCAEIVPPETFLVVAQEWYPPYQEVMYKLLAPRGMGWFACAQGSIAVSSGELEEITEEMATDNND